MKRILFVLWLLSFCGFSSAVSATARRDIPAVPDMESSWFVNLDRFANSAHGTFPCEQCHTDLDKGDTLHPVSESAASLMKSATRLYDYSRCRTCHRTSYEKYLLGEHARALQKEKSKPENQDLSGAAPGNAPTCGDCHSSHYVKSHLSRLETGRRMTEVCGSCHPAQKASYLENYHGKAAVNLGNDRAAFCTDCHGAHQCISLKDKKAALTACRRCHPEAGTELCGVCDSRHPERHSRGRQTEEATHRSHQSHHGADGHHSHTGSGIFLRTYLSVDTAGTARAAEEA